MKQILLSFLLSGSLFAGPAHDLAQGTFESDRDATVARWKKEQPWGDRTKIMIEKLGAILGVHRVTIKDGKMHSVSGDFTEDSAYTLVEEKRDEIVVRSFSKVLKREITSTVVPDKDGYWIHSDDPLPGYMERYRRIEENREHDGGLNGLQP